jgi:ligand-binding sensor domain-containing protein
MGDPFLGGIMTGITAIGAQRALKWVCLGLIGLTHFMGFSGFSAELGSNSAPLHFKFNRYTAENEALYKSLDSSGSYDNVVFALFVDSKARLWVGTVTGLSMHDGKEWEKRTLRREVPAGPLGFLARRSSFGPRYFTEGPSGTIWLGGGCALTRFREGRYEGIDPGTTAHGVGILGMAADRKGSLWVVTHENVQKYDGKTWTTVLSPYPGRVRMETATLYGAAVGTNGDVWIGGNAWGKLTEPFEHEGAIWVVDQEDKKRNGGPPMAPLFEFDGSKWKAYGKPQGLNAGFAVPELDGLGSVVARTPAGYFFHKGEIWEPVGEADALAGRRWILRMRNKGLLEGHSELLFRDGKRLVEVRPTDAQTGEVLDVGSEQFGLLCIAEDGARDCVWLGTTHGLYRIWREENGH